MKKAFFVCLGFFSLSLKQLRILSLSFNAEIEKKPDQQVKFLNLKLERLQVKKCQSINESKINSEGFFRAIGIGVVFGHLSPHSKGCPKMMRNFLHLRTI